MEAEQEATMGRAREKYLGWNKEQTRDKSQRNLRYVTKRPED